MATPDAGLSRCCQENQVQIMVRSIRVAFYSLLLVLVCVSSYADELSRQQMRSLDEQVQEVKTDVL